MWHSGCSSGLSSSSVSCAPDCDDVEGCCHGVDMAVSTIYMLCCQPMSALHAVVVPDGGSNGGRQQIER